MTGALPSIPNLVVAQRHYFNSGATKSRASRLVHLKKLRAALTKFEIPLLRALHDDLGRSETDSIIAELGILRSEIDAARRELCDWMEPQQVVTPLLLQPGASRIVPEPKGVVLVIAPWNYPLQLLIAPAIAAIAAGNCVILKPSELAPRTADVVAEMVKEFFPSEFFAVVLGAVNETQALLQQKFDHIFFTGGEAVGKIVAKAAAEHLTPMTLELGGKSPAVIAPDANLDAVAKRLVWAKFFNAGQTCVAPDYVLLPENRQDEFIAAAKKWLSKLHGENPQQSPDLCRVINDRHFQRLEALLQGGEVVVGGKSDAKTRYFAPTIIKNPKLHHLLMTEEIFGPILPLVTYQNYAEAIAFVRERPKPLALYGFSKRRRYWQDLVEQVSFGGGCWNDLMMHLASEHLPFGGVGVSGYGSYHGYAGFATFSHFKSLYETTLFWGQNLRYPRHHPLKQRLIRWWYR